MHSMSVSELLNNTWYLKDDPVISSTEKVKNIIERLEAMGEIVVFHV